MFRFVCAAVFLASAATSPVLAKDNDKGKSETEQAEKKVCKSSVKTGSIMPVRVCRTRAEWDAMTAQGQADMDRTRAMERSRSLVESSR